MHAFRWAAIWLALNAGCLRAAGPDGPEPSIPPLLSLAELQARLDNPRLRLLDARPKADYDKGHIPGALWVDLKGLQALTAGVTIANAGAWGKALAPLGIGPDADVFVYDADRQHDAGRVWWLLAYAGVEDVGLVDGGFPLWAREGRPVTAEVREIEPHLFAPKFHPAWVADREAVRKAVAAGEPRVVDARTAAEYSGEVKPKDGTRAGHIPKAISFDAYELVDAEGRLVAPPAQRERLARAGVALDRPMIAYVGSGGRSGLFVFALRRLRVPAIHYVRGISDWRSDPTCPLVEGTAP